MTIEENIKKELLDRFGMADEGIIIKRSRRIFTSVQEADFNNVFVYAVNNLNFKFLCTITGLDEGENFSFIYHLADDNGVVLNLKRCVPKSNPVIDTITNFFPGAILYERELEDMFGAQVKDLPPGRNYPLPEGWPKGEHPLRKDWNPDVLKNQDKEVKCDE